MSGIASLLLVARAYGAAQNVPQTTVSKRALQDSSRLSELEAGDSDIGVKRLERTLRWFSDHWPADTDWPADVPRPDLYPPPAPTAPARSEAVGV